MRLHRRAGILGLTSIAALLMMSGPSLADPPADDPAPRTVDTEFSPQEISIMAKSAGRTESQQAEHLQAQQDQNNAYAALAAEGNAYDGAYFTEDNSLVLQAAEGSPEAAAAEKAGLTVVEPEHGEAELAGVTEKVTAATASEPSVATITPDVAADRVIVTVTGDPAAVRDLLAPFGDAVEVRTGEANTMQVGVLGGDALYLDGRSRCSAGFPARTSGGARVMVWAGHCLENVTNVTTTSGTRIGTTGDTKFHSYDGQDDRDMGYVRLDAEDSVSTDTNDYNSRYALDASSGVWRAPVGTDACKSGSTTGITCGKITGYGSTVTYSDQQGRVQARVTGLGSASICTEGGDSGGAYVAGGYAVGMTSGGPSNQTCGGFNAGNAGGSSYFQPVDDALRAYGLTYGG